MKSIVYIDMDNVLCDFNGAYESAIKNEPQVVYPQSQYGFYANLMPIQDAIASVEWLINSKEFDPYILTSPSVRNPFSYTEKRVWVEQHISLEFVNKLIISPDKSLLKGDFLIDDNIKGRGQDRFEGEVLQFGSQNFSGWKDVIAYLKSKV